MAVRKNKAHHEIVRSRIQTSQLINRLMDHVRGKVELSATQVTAALGLMRKTLPDLQAVELSGEVITKRDVSADPLPADQWDERYSQTAH